MASAAFAARITPTTTVAPPTMATSAPPVNSVGRVVAPAQLLRLSTSQQEQARTRSPFQALHMQLQQFQIHHPSAAPPNGANSSSLSANRHPQRSQAEQQSRAATRTLAASKRLAVWRRSSASSPPPSSSSSSSSSSVSITRASAHHPQLQQARLHRLESLENKLLVSDSELFVANGNARVVAAAQCESPVCVTSSHRHRSEADALAAKTAAAAAVAHHNQVAANKLTRKKLVSGRPPTLTTLTATRVANLQVHAKLSAAPTKLTSTPATTNSRLRQGALYARRQYHITAAAAAAAASAVGPSSSSSAAAAALSSKSLSGRLTSAKCSLNAATTTSSLSTAQLAPTTRSSSRTLASISALGRVRPLSRAAKSAASLTTASATSAAATGRIVASIVGGLSSHSSASIASSTLQLIHSRSSNCRQKQQQYNCSRLLTSRFLRSSTPTNAAARAQSEQAQVSGRNASSKFGLLSSSTSSLSLGSAKRARAAPRVAREKAAALEIETSITDSHTRNHYHSSEQQQEHKMQLQSQQQNQKRPIGLSRRSSSSSSGSEGCGGGNVKRLTSLNNSSLRASSLAVNSPGGVSGGVAGGSSRIQPSRRQSTPASNRSTLISSASAGASTSTAAEAAAAATAATAAYLTAISQQQQRRGNVDLAVVVCNALSHADQRKPAVPAAAITARSRSRSSSDSDSGASSNGDNNNNNDNHDNVHKLAAKSHKNLTSNLVSIKNSSSNTINGNPLPFIDKPLSFSNQEHQLNCQPVCKGIIAAAASATAAAAVAVAAARDKMKIQSEQLVTTAKDKLTSSSIINNNNINNNINHNNNNNNRIATGLGCTPDIPIRTEPMSDYYDLEARPFARGKFAQVKRCINKSTKQCFAAKCIKKRRRLVDIRHEILLEIEALKLSYHTDRIVKLFEVFETQTEITLILEMANGGELQRVLDEEEVIDEKLVKRMIRQILEGLVALHDIDIAHLDIKPQNLLLTQSFPNGDIKLCDFGISRRITKDCEIREICGTPDYVAPEILSYDPISLATDMWSLGVLTYVLLSGYSPFGSEDKQQTFCNITQANLDFPSEIFEKISDEAIDFMRKLILRDPSERLTSRQAKKHPWLYSEP